MKTICLLVLLASVSAMAQDSSAAPTLPKSAGPYAIGTAEFEIIDPERRDLYYDSERKIPVKVWYPAEEVDLPQETYLKDEDLLNKMIAQGYNHQDSSALQLMASYRVNSVTGAPIKGKERLPLILFSHGLGVSKINYSLFAEAFASQGYITVMIDHPYGGFTRTREGRLMSSRQDTLLNSEKMDSMLVVRANEWIQDLHTLLDQILADDTAIGRTFSRHIDQTRIISMGHSLGGNVALQYPATDSRVIAAVNLDGGSFGSLTGPPQVPSLTLRSQPVYTDEELQAKGRNREDWNAMGKEIDAVFSAALTGSEAAYEIKIKQSGHMSFSDAPYVLPDMITRFGGKILSPGESFRVIREAILIFLRATFRGEKPEFQHYLQDCTHCEFKTYEKREE